MVYITVSISCTVPSLSSYTVTLFCHILYNTVYSPVDIQFDGCSHGKDDVWNIPWSNTERGESDTQSCPGRNTTGTYEGEMISTIVDL